MAGGITAGQLQQGLSLGGVGDVDTLLIIDSFDTSSGLTETDPGISNKGFRLTHAAGSTEFAEKTFDLPAKYRDKLMELSVELQSTASEGNFKVIITDETNSKTLADEVLSKQSTSETVKRVVSFSTKPAYGDSSILSIKVRFEALQEAGSPTTDFDDISLGLKKTQSLQLESISQEENVFSGRITNNGSVASLVSQSKPFVSSVNRISIGTIEVGFIPGFFSVIPSVVISPDIGGTAMSQVVIVDADTIRLVSRDSNGNQIDADFSFTATRQGLDYRDIERKVEREISTFNEVIVEEEDTHIVVSGAEGSSGPVTLTFSQLDEQRGSSISYNESSGEFTVLEEGLYQLHVKDTVTVAGSLVFIRINGVEVASQVGSTDLYDTQASATEYLSPGDVITFTAQNSRGAAGQRRATVTKQGSLKKASVVPDSKIKIPTSELRMSGSTGFGAGGEAFTTQYDSIESILGDGFVINNSNGTVIEVKKDGILNVSASALLPTLDSQLIIGKNSDGSGLPTPNQRMASASAQKTQSVVNVASEFKVKSGDFIRIHCNAASVISDNANTLVIAHQEQDISVAISNVTPQFEDADSVLEVYGNAGTSITGNVTDIPYTTILTTKEVDGAWNGSQFTVPESGIWDISCGVSLNSDAARIVSLYKNGSHYRAISYDTIQPLFGSFTGYFNQGEILSIRVDASTTLTNVEQRHYLTISKIGKPSIAEVDVTPFVDLDQYRTKYSSARLAGNQGQSLSTNDPIPYNIISDDSGAWSGDTYTVQADNSAISIDGSVALLAAANYYVGVYVNGTLLYYDVYNGVSTDTRPYSFLLPKGSTARGDSVQIRLENVGGTLQGGETTNYLNIIEEYEVENRRTLRSVAQSENSFSARISSAGAIINQSESFIQSVAVNATGRYTVNFVPGFFSEIPSCTATVESGGANRNASVISPTLNSIDVNTQNTATDVAVDEDFTLVVHRQGADKVNLAKAIVDLGPSYFDTDIFEHSKWESFTPTGTWSTGTWSGFKRRVGDTLEVRGRFLVSSAPVGNFDVTLPDNLRIDTEKFQSSLSSLEGLGNLSFYLQGPGEVFYGRMHQNSDTEIRGYYFFDSGAEERRRPLSNNNPGALVAGDIVEFDFKVPIAGWNDTRKGIVLKNSETEDIDNENILSARLNLGSLAVQVSKFDWIESVTKPSTGDYRINFKPGVFTVAPSVHVASGDGGWSTRVLSATPTQVRFVNIRHDLSTSTTEDMLFLEVLAVKQGDDYVRESEKVYTIPVNEKQRYASATASDINASTATRFTLTAEDDAGNLVEATRINIPENGLYEISAGGNVAFGDSNWATISYRLDGSAVDNPIGVLTPNSVAGMTLYPSVIRRLAKGQYVEFWQSASGSSGTLSSIRASIKRIPDNDAVFVGEVARNKFQTKILSADQGAGTTDLSDLQFNNLEIGKHYRITGQVKTSTIGGTTSLSFRDTAGGAGVFYGGTSIYSDGGSQDISQTGVNIIFTATSTNLYCRAGVSGGCTLEGDGTRENTFITLEELSSHTQTTDFT